jgi:hypothetical protein
MTKTKLQQPNYTQVPNLFFALLPEMSQAECYVMLCAIRHIIGWHKEDPEPISKSLLMKETGLSKPAVIKGVTEAIERGWLVEVDNAGIRGCARYTLNFEDIGINEIDPHEERGKDSLPVPVNLVYPSVEEGVKIVYPQKKAVKESKKNIVAEATEVADATILAGADDDPYLQVAPTPLEEELQPEPVKPKAPAKAPTISVKADFDDYDQIANPGWDKPKQLTGTPETILGIVRDIFPAIDISNKKSWEKLMKPVPVSNGDGSITTHPAPEELAKTNTAFRRFVRKRCDMLKALWEKEPTYQPKKGHEFKAIVTNLIDYTKKTQNERWDGWLSWKRTQDIVESSAFKASTAQGQGYENLSPVMRYAQFANEDNSLF